jgi:ribosomal-protein-alanine N-acetyltransferase
LGARSVFLEVAADNVPALGFYKSLEFEQVGRRSGYYQRSDGTQCDALILRKSLT